MALSQDRIPLIEEGKETFRMVELKKDACKVLVTDGETGWSPELNLEPRTKHAGSHFLGGIYLSQWNNQMADREYIVTVEYFRGDSGRKILQTEVYLNYGKTFTSKDIEKNSRHVVFIDSKNKVSNFEEKLKISRPGAYKLTDLVSVQNPVQVDGTKVSFSRTVENGIQVNLDCDLED